MKIRPFVQLLAIAGSALAFLPLQAQAASCSVNQVTINKIEVTPLDGQGIVYQAPPPLTSTGCVFVDGQNDTGTLLPTNNIGELNDGVMNGEGGLLSPTQFTANNPVPLMALNADGLVNDPGWIRLGEVGGDVTTFKYEDVKGYGIDNLLSVSMTCTSGGTDQCLAGTWSLETKSNIIELVTNLLNGRKSFDHLAFILKAGNGFAVYDFDFNVLAADIVAWQAAHPGSSQFDFDTPYAFTGTWSDGDFLNPNNNNFKALSHMSVWVRDPVTTNTVPAPGTLLLLGAALLAMGLQKRT